MLPFTHKGRRAAEVPSKKEKPARICVRTELHANTVRGSAVQVLPTPSTLFAPLAQGTRITVRTALTPIEFNNIQSLVFHVFPLVHRMAGQMHITKRDGRAEPVMFDKITDRIKALCTGLNQDYVDPVVITQKVVQGFHNGITSSQVDTLAAETCAYMSQRHHDFSTLAARIAISNLHKNTLKSFSDTCRSMFEFEDKQGRSAALISDEVWNFIRENASQLDAAADYERDFAFDYFGFKTLEKSYLLRVHGHIVERPQHMWLRVACGIHTGDLSAALETYDLMSRRLFTHATPTLFNAGTLTPQMSSCFLLKMKEWGCSV